jgi:tRNA(His) guanylyltransferase
MKFDDLDKRMRIYETAHDHCVLPGMFMVARVDGRSFTRLTKEIHQFETPFDKRFNEYMVLTAEHLMKCGFRVTYAYTQSDEISLLMHRGENLFERKLRKFESILAGEASAFFSLLLGSHAAFDCRVCQLPLEQDVIDYFRWRQEDARRNALNAHCYWLWRKKGKSPTEANSALLKLSTAEKNEFLFQGGINFNNLPNWQKRGVGLYLEQYKKEYKSQKTGKHVQADRRRIKIDEELPMKKDYDEFLTKKLKESIN